MGLSPGRLLVPVVLHRPAARLLRQIKWRLLPGSDGYVPFVRDPVELVPDAASCPGSPSRSSTPRSTPGSPATRCSRPWARTTSAPRGPRASPSGSSSASTRLRAGLTPIVTAAGLDLAGLLGGAIITEQHLQPPRHRSAVASTRSIDSDLPVITGTVLVAATFVIVANLIVDLLYAVIDPRVRLDVTRGHFLDVRDLRVQFPTEDGLVRAVDGVSFSVEKGKTLAIVGESGSGKSVTSQAIMGLHQPQDRQGHRRGLPRRRGARRRTTASRCATLRGKRMAMIFQDPLS